MKTTEIRNGLGAAAFCSILLLAICGVMLSGAKAESYASQCPLSADLTGSAISNMTPAGTARFREKGNSRLMINLRQVNVAADTNLDVYAGETKIGTIKVGRGRSGQLRLDSPTAAIDENTVITVRNGSDTILTGNFVCTSGGGKSNSNNTNINSNSNNANTNMNTNSNRNSNSNRNTNSNSNSNSNSNRNTNRNSNSNSNTNTRPTPTPSPAI